MSKACHKLFSKNHNIHIHTENKQKPKMENFCLYLRTNTNINTQNMEKSLHLNTHSNMTKISMTWCDFVAAILSRNFCLYPLTLLADMKHL